MSIAHQLSTMGNLWNKSTEPIETSSEEDNWIKGLRATLLENIRPLEAAEDTTETVIEVKQMIEDNIKTYNEVQKTILN